MKYTYKYQGPAEILAATKGQPAGTVVSDAEDVLAWLEQTQQVVGPDGLYWVTYVVTDERGLLIADRRSEHVTCAGGGTVLAAGELAFRLEGGVSVIEATNQSTGFCPRPECWQAVAAVLQEASIPAPPEFTSSYDFRRCPACGACNIVKDEYFICSCGGELPAEWNF